MITSTYIIAVLKKPPKFNILIIGSGKGHYSIESDLFSCFSDHLIVTIVLFQIKYIIMIIDTCLYDSYKRFALLFFLNK